MVVDTVCEWNKRCARQTPAKATSDNCQECSNVLFSQILLVLYVTHAWDDVVVLVLMEYLMEHLPFNLKLHFVGFNVTLQDSVLKLFYLTEIPQHW